MFLGKVPHFMVAMKCMLKIIYSIISSANNIFLFVHRGINSTWTINTQENLTATVFIDDPDTNRAVGYTAVTYLDITNPTNVKKTSRL
jgi:hypothetical protein